jgi:hypothetical protein
MSSFGLSPHTLRLPLVFVGLMFLTSCSNLNPLSLLTGSGTNVAANVQAGAENNQGVNIKTEAPSVSLRPKSRVETIDQSTTTNNTTTVDPFLIILLLLGWVLPSPNEISRVVRGWFKRK